MKFYSSLALVAGTLACGSALAAPITVSDIGGGSAWNGSATTSGGTYEIVDLAGAGGDLETAVPLGTGAIKLTTDATTSAKAEIGTFEDFGTTSSLFDADFELSYSWYSTDDGTVAAPAIKLAFINPDYAGDGYGQLIYEPYWQVAGSPVKDQWVTSTIDVDNGLFWSTEMFNFPNGGGGPPLRTLSEWLAEGDAGFGASSLFGVSVGLGSNNPNEIGYVDNVSIKGTMRDATYDFERVVTPVPTPASRVICTPVMFSSTSARF